MDENSIATSINRNFVAFLANVGVDMQESCQLNIQKKHYEVPFALSLSHLYTSNLLFGELSTLRVHRYGEAGIVRFFSTATQQ